MTADSRAVPAHKQARRTAFKRYFDWSQTIADLSVRDRVVRRGVELEVVRVAWMAAEAVLATGAGIAPRSVLLTALGRLRRG